MKIQVLVVDDDQAHLTMLVAMLKSWGYGVTTATDGSEAVGKVETQPFDVVLTDVRMAQMDGIEALRRIRDFNPFLPVLIMTAYSSLGTAVDALKAGAYDYLHKPLDFDELRLALKRAVDHASLRQENTRLRREAGPALDMIGKSAAMNELVDMIQAVAPSEASVLILGESGTGKELVAKALHQNSARAGRELVTINCAALAENLLESELFGHEKGAFTGADRRREGRFVQADKGTLFLDEIGEMALPLQAKLLRALQDGEVQRVGSDRSMQVDVRILAATNRDLEAAVQDGTFREDLFYRLNVISLRVPPLRERQDDIPLLAQYFLTRFADRNHKHFRGFAPRAMDAMLHYAWPGNVRELENVVERAVILAVGEHIAETDLPPALRPGTDLPQVNLDLAGQSLEDVERAAIIRTLEQAGQNKSETARILGVTRVTLRAKMRKFGLS